MPDYRKFQSDTLAHPTRGPQHANVITDVARTLVTPDRFIAGTGGDPGNLNGLIDAQLDRLIVASDGDQRLALFAAVVALGQALTMMMGP